jgi:hypothetical protein
MKIKFRTKLKDTCQTTFLHLIYISDGGDAKVGRNKWRRIQNKSEKKLKTFLSCM